MCHNVSLPLFVHYVRSGEEIVAPAVETPPRVVNLMEALKKSLDAVSTTKKKPAKAAVAQTAAKRKRA